AEAALVHRPPLVVRAAHRLVRGARILHVGLELIARLGALLPLVVDQVDDQPRAVRLHEELPAHGPLPDLLGLAEGIPQLLPAHPEPVIEAVDPIGEGAGAGAGAEEGDQHHRPEESQKADGEPAGAHTELTLRGPCQWTPTRDDAELASEGSASA